MTAPLVVIEGISDWAAKHYFPVLARMIRTGALGQLCVVDDSSSYSNNPLLQRLVSYRKAQLIAALRPHLLDCIDFLDKAGQEQQKAPASWPMPLVDPLPSF